MRRRESMDFENFMTAHFKKETHLFCRIAILAACWVGDRFSSSILIGPVIFAGTLVWGAVR